jgi:nitrite reductase/ring-hydroxylating ferredoxin subunit
VEEGIPLAFQTGDVPVLLVRWKKSIRAFRNQCAHQGLPLDGGIVDDEAGTLTCPWHGWCYDATSGECLTAVQAQLEEFPLRLVDGRVWIRP